MVKEDVSGDEDSEDQNRATDEDRTDFEDPRSTSTQRTKIVS